MKALRLTLHVAGILISIALLLGIPFLTSDYGQAWLQGGEVDAVSSATGLILDAPSGSYYVLINREFRKDAQSMQDWAAYFSGESDYILSFEDISCSVAETDTGAVDMAESFQSRLPDGQMKVQKVNATLLISRAECDCYDFLIMSEEFAQANGFRQELCGNVQVLKIGGSS